MFDQATVMIRNDRDISYMDAMIEALESFADMQIDSEGLSSKTVNGLTEILNEADIESIGTDTIRQALQMISLKAIKEDKIQPNFQITPNTIGDVVAYIAAGLLEGNSSISMLDPALGSANLLTTVAAQLKKSLGVSADLYGIENDDTMFELAGVSLDLQKVAAQLYHADAVVDVMVPPVDLIVSDLPVGYYPIDDNVKNFETKAKEGHSFVHHLYLEMSANHLKDGGFGIFVVPSSIFQTTEAKSLLKWMSGRVYLQGILNLPKELFASESAQKSILIMQKTGANAKQAEPVMLGEFPSFKDGKAVQKFLTEIDEWRKNNLK
nr:class I SAM-dependent methyltransferase [Lentilactobacillus sp. Marseille-Q4993]